MYVCVHSAVSYIQIWPRKITFCKQNAYHQKKDLLLQVLIRDLWFSHGVCLRSDGDGLIERDVRYLTELRIDVVSPSKVLFFSGIFCSWKPNKNDLADFSRTFKNSSSIAHNTFLKDLNFITSLNQYYHFWSM